MYLIWYEYIVHDFSKMCVDLNENDQLKLEYIHQQMSIHSVLCRRK